ncbi:DNA topoisomerase [Burkholderia sp. LMG 13014]|uniref:DNA topoisomerase n=1 Tax=Burkholderia sp. LMG 13014 TaxID=2709306 RepID=UPI0019646181|nr:DNA topoisomerase [Burkholderia sp. LMG 13014]
MADHHRTLVITDSDAIAARLQQILGVDYVVTSTGGQICDLPVEDLGIDSSTFTPVFRLTARGRAEIMRLRGMLRHAHEILLAPSCSREGEALCWHLSSRLRVKHVFRLRVTELTPEAVHDALAHRSAIDFDLIHAHQARRGIDRLIGYTVSRPLAARLERKGLSTGRLQAAAVALLVERERMHRRHQSVESHYAELMFADGPTAWYARWTPTRPRTPKARTNAAFSGSVLTPCDDAQAAQQASQVRQLIVTAAARRQVTYIPPSPLNTASMQLQAASRWGYSIDAITAAASTLFIAGHITLPVTTQTDISSEAALAIRAWALQAGLPVADRPNRFPSRNVAGEAPEAIRPTRPEIIEAGATDIEQHVYMLIRNRAIQSQLAPALYDTQDITLTDMDSTTYRYRATGCQLLKPGYIEFGVENATFLPDDPDDVPPESPTLPELARGDSIIATSGNSGTAPVRLPPRYTPATLCMHLDALRIGLPAAYSHVLATLSSRGYAEQRGGYLVPTRQCELVYDTIHPHFAYTHLIHAQATEQTLDAIAAGRHSHADAIKQEWEKLAAEMPRFENVPVVALPRTEQIKACPQCGRLMDLARGPHGTFWSCTGFVANPACDHTEAAG